MSRADELPEFPTPMETFGKDPTRPTAQPFVQAKPLQQYQPPPQPYQHRTHSLNSQLPPPPLQSPSSSSSPHHYSSSPRPVPFGRPGSPSSVSLSSGSNISNQQYQNYSGPFNANSYTYPSSPDAGHLAYNSSPQNNQSSQKPYFNNSRMSNSQGSFPSGSRPNVSTNINPSNSNNNGNINGGWNQPSPFSPSSSGQQQIQPPQQQQQSIEPNLKALFQGVDTNKNGQLSENELRNALVNGDYTKFNIATVRLMMKMFDRNGNGTIGFKEFCNLWRYLGEWRKLFDRFDLDQSGSINYDEYCRALEAFGYRLSNQFIAFMYNKHSSFDRQGVRVISFDMFVQSCLSLKRFTDIFKKYDKDRDGFITLAFEDFLYEIINLT